MPSIQCFLLLVLLVATSTQGFLKKKLNVEENENTAETYKPNIKTIVQDVKDALSLKKEMVVDAVSGIGNAKHGIIQNLKDTKKKLVDSVLAPKIAKVNAIIAAKDEYMKTIMAQPFFFFKTKLQKVKGDAPTLPPVEDLKSRFFDFFLQFADKFQGHFKKNKISQNESKDTLFTFIPRTISNDHPQIREIPTYNGNHKQEMTFIPSPALSMAIHSPMAQTTDTPSEYVQPVRTQPQFEYLQPGDLLPGYQPSQFSPPSDYDQPIQVDFTQPAFSNVDYNKDQSIPYVPSQYYGAPQASANLPSDTYGGPN